MYANDSNLTSSGYLMNWPHITFDLHLRSLTSWTCEGSYIISINQVWFQSDFYFSNEVNFTVWAHLITWPLMTFDLGIWPLTTWKNKRSHIVSINHIWFQSDINFSNEDTFTFSAYLTTWPQMAFDLNLWPFTSSTNSHVASMTQLWLESIKACG